jgi:hypothetical protein
MHHGQILFSHCEKKKSEFQDEKSLRAESGRKDGRELAELETISWPATDIVSEP